MGGVTATTFQARGLELYLAQVGRHILLASDPQSFSSAASTIKGERPSLAQSITYNETMAGLDHSNLLTMYVNLAPIQGLGYLAEGLGLRQLPVYGSIAGYLESVQAMGLGLGYDGDVASLTMFCRAKPGATIDRPAIIAGTAIGAVCDGSDDCEDSRKEARIGMRVQDR